MELPQSCVLSVAVFWFLQFWQVEAAAMNLIIQEEVTLWKSLRQSKHTHTHTVIPVTEFLLH